MSTSTARSWWQRFPRLRPTAARGDIGIEAGERWVRIIQHRPAGWRTASLMVGSGGLDGSKTTGIRIRRAAHEAGIEPGPAICAYTSPAIDVFPLSIKTKGADSLAALVVSYARDQLSYPLTDAVLDYAELRPELRRTADDTTAVLAFAAPRRLAENLVHTFDHAGFRVDCLLTPPCVLAPRIARTAEGQRHLLIVTAEGASSVSVIQDGHILLERMLSWSLEGLVQRLVAELGLTAVQCRALLGGSTPATPDPGANTTVEGAQLGSALREILGPSFQDLAREAAGCVGYCNSLLIPQDIASIVVLGPLAKHELLRDALRRGLDLPLTDISGALDLPAWQVEDDIATYATAASCALWHAQEAA